jgi:hypothetical protein
VHPAHALIEALIDKELAPGHGTIDVEAFIARDLQLGTKKEGGMRID